MPHAEVDDNFAEHPKVWALSDAAYRLHSSGIFHCARLMTDGFVAADKVSKLVPKYRRKTLDELVSCGMWNPVGLNGQIVSYEIHDYLDWNKSREQILENKRKAAQRKADFIARQRQGAHDNANA